MALSVETAFADPSRVYPGLKTGLRGIVPCGVRTFLPGLAPGAILRPSEIKLKLGPVGKRNKGEENLNSAFRVPRSAFATADQSATAMSMSRVK